MDHRVSKDMISSGMTPSGKKSQADLGKTQYGSAPSPNKLMDAYHSMYQNQKEQTLEEKMNPADIKKFNQMGQKASKIENKNIKREKIQNIYNKAGEQGLTDDVDLLAAYRAVYEHHKKDENGNTIPHEDDVKEGKIPAGLQAYLDKKKGKKDDKEGKKEDVKEYAALATGALKMVGAKKAAAVVAKKGVMKSTALAANRAKNTAVKKVKDIANDPRVQSAAISSVSSGGGGQDKEKTGMVSASADLFDIVKGQLLDEGLSEEEIKDIMLTLTPEEILNEMGAKFPAGKGANYRETPKPKPQERLGTGRGADYVEKPKPKPGEPGSKFDAKGRKRYTGAMTPYSSENMKDT